MEKFFFLFGGVFYFISCNVFAQVSGTVFDQSTERPLAGATVLIKDSPKGTVTDLNGAFSIDANPEDTVVVSYLGYLTQEIPVGAQTHLSIGLMQDELQMEEVVVTGYTAQSKKSITGSIAVVDLEEAQKVPVQSIEQLLQGTASGVYVSQEGSPGGATMVRIRGFGTLRNNDPLYVIDGTPTKLSLGEINPSDVASIQVLKDASAASIYGSRAANGVVIVTTKNGSREGSPKISYEGYVGTQVVGENNFPKLLNPVQEADFIFESQINATGTFFHPWYGDDPNGPVLPDFLNPAGGFLGPDGVTIYDQMGNLTPYTIHDYGIDADNPQTTRLIRANKEGTDWLDAIFTPALIMNHDLTASGGKDNMRYLFSAGYYNQEGVVVHTGYDRYSLRMNSEFFVRGRVRIGENISVVYAEKIGDRSNQFGAVFRAQTTNPIVPLKDEGGRFLGPLENLFVQKDNKGRRLRAFGNAFLEVDLLKDRNLTFKTNIGLDYINTNLTDYFEITNFIGSVFNNDLFEASEYITNWTWTNTVVYEETFGADHNLNVLIGVEAIENNIRRFGARRSGFSVSDVSFRYLNAGQENPANIGDGTKWSLWSQFGKIDYVYQDKYLASFTIRRDGSSRFGQSHRFGVFPAFSAGWRISEESFLSKFDFLNDLKLRFGWGETGNQEIGDFNFACTFAPNIQLNNYDIGGTNNSVVSGYARSQNCNPNAQWETTITLDYGLDARLLDNKVEVAFDWYQQDTKDMLIQVPQPGLAGQAEAPFLNVGEMENRGFDLSVGYHSDQNNKFTYDVSLNLSHYRNEVVSLGDIPETFFPGRRFDLGQPNRTISGQPIASFFGYVVDGIFQDQAEVDAHATQDGKAPGRFRIMDQVTEDTDDDGVPNAPDGRIDENDRTFIGSPHPDVTWGLNLTLGYNLEDAGKIGLTVFGQGVYGNDLFNNVKWFTDFGRSGNAQSIRQLNRWSPENPDGNLPQANVDRPSIESAISTYYVEDGSYWRLRNVQISYDLPPPWLSSLGVNHARIYLQGKNILTITDYSGIDPEIGLFDRNETDTNFTLGIDQGAYPVAKVFLVGVNVEF